jgi:hypothetical protein
MSHTFERCGEVQLVSDRSAVFPLVPPFPPHPYLHAPRSKHNHMRPGGLRQLRPRVHSPTSRDGNLRTFVSSSEILKDPYYNTWREDKKYVRKMLQVLKDSDKNENDKDEDFRT